MLDVWRPTILPPISTTSEEMEGLLDPLWCSKTGVSQSIFGCTAGCKQSRSVEGTPGMLSVFEADTFNARAADGRRSNWCDLSTLNFLCLQTASWSKHEKIKLHKMPSRIPAPAQLQPPPNVTSLTSVGVVVLDARYWGEEGGREGGRGGFCKISSRAQFFCSKKRKSGSFSFQDLVKCGRDCYRFALPYRHQWDRIQGHPMPSLCCIRLAHAKFAILVCQGMCKCANARTAAHHLECNNTVVLP